MFAKLVLPRLGGSPSVWNTCVLFFQAMLLIGYAYVHLSTRWLSARAQALCHLVVLLLPIGALPLSDGENWPSLSGSPVWWLLGLMTLQVGLPFFAVSTTAPVLQRWYAALPSKSGADPYVLYAASNIGSLLALVAYPLLLEPTMGVRSQTWLWTAGYALLMLLVGTCGLLVASTSKGGGSHESAASTEREAVLVSTRVRWVLCSFAPSSLMLGVTTLISTDIAAIPLLWVLPLALYLSTFVIVFSSRKWHGGEWAVKLLPFLILGSLSAIAARGTSWWLILLHIVTFFVCALVCHGELARLRPPASGLTGFYMWMSVGGVIGGVFNSLVATTIFSTILEYPLVLALVAFMSPAPTVLGPRSRSDWMDVGVPVLALAVWAGLWAAGLTSADQRQQMFIALSLIVSALFMVDRKPAVFGFTAVLWVGIIAFAKPALDGSILFADRSFFGRHQVIDASDHSYHLLLHGNTAHGRQEMSADGRCRPTGYYHASGPIGQLFRATGNHFRDVAVLGLGTGSLACYAARGDSWTYYEIDPMVERIARDPRLFTYLMNSEGRPEVVLGDGRLTLNRAKAEAYDLIVLDAFSSDAIPVHLMTREATRMYLSKLSPEGIIAFHISNRFLRLEPVLGAIARDEGLFTLANRDVEITKADAIEGRFPSHWVVMARVRKPLATLVGKPGWRPTEIRENVRAWSDDYSNIVRVLGP